MNTLIITITYFYIMTIGLGVVGVVQSSDKPETKSEIFADIREMIKDIKKALKA